jgi:hypothetical protein
VAIDNLDTSKKLPIMITGIATPENMMDKP